MLRQGLALIVLKDAYFHISIRSEYCCFLRFSLDGVIYEFKALSFGLSTSPRVFTKCLALVVAHLQLRGMTAFPYLDDWLLVASSLEKLLHDISFTLSLLSTLGLQVNHEKSTLHPTQRVTYI